MSLSGLTVLPPDPLLAVSHNFGEDFRLKRMNLGIGVYCNEAGETPVMPVVKSAEAMVLDRQVTKAYLGPEGDSVFIERLLSRLIQSQRPMQGIQTVGGSGALSLAAEVLARSNPDRKIWVGTPSWPNHLPIFGSANLAVREVPLGHGDQFDQQRLLDALAEAEAGDVVLVQACCHNPSGMDLDNAGWEKLATIMADRGLIALVDVAYHGLGDGLDVDLGGLHRILALVPEVLIAYSCNKNFGLYRDRVGAIFVATPKISESDAARSHLVTAARARYSMPPDHGAAVVSTILGDDLLFRQWQGELATMRQRITGLRRELAGFGIVSGIDLTTLKAGRGMFALLPIKPQIVDRLAIEHAIYMARSGRINIAGLPGDGAGRLVNALKAACSGSRA
jgi:aromatic-amino-acid transaminase